MNSAKNNTAIENADQELLKNPVLKQLHHYFSNRQTAIEALKEQQPNDELIREFIGNAFGIYGGGSLNPEGWYEYSGGKNPRLEIQDRNFTLTHKLEGQQLIAAFRLVFKIPAGNQLNLF